MDVAETQTMKAVWWVVAKSSSAIILGELASDVARSDRNRSFLLLLSTNKIQKPEMKPIHYTMRLVAKSPKRNPLKVVHN